MVLYYVRIQTEFSVSCKKETTSLMIETSQSIGHFRKYHNTLCLSHCFCFLKGPLKVPRETKRTMNKIKTRSQLTFSLGKERLLYDLEKVFAICFMDQCLARLKQILSLFPPNMGSKQFDCPITLLHFK